MERTKSKSAVIPLEAADGDNRIHFKKIGGGSFRLGNRIIKPGETFLARPEEIPVGFRDVVIAQEAEKNVAKPIIVAKPVYTLQPRGKSKSLFDVVDAQGKVLNEKALSKEDAQGLIDDLAK